MSVNSPHWQIATNLESSVDTWAQANWPATVEAGFSFEDLQNLVTEDQPVVIGLMPLAVRDEQNELQDLITVGVFVFAKTDSIKTAKVLPFDRNTNLLRSHLRTVAAIDVDILLPDDTTQTETAERRRTTLTTVFDHGELRREIWASMIEMEYALCTGGVE